MATFTVTATQGGSAHTGMALRVLVLTQAAATQNGGTAAAHFASTSTFTLSVTTTQTGSRVYAASVVTPKDSATAAAATTVIDNITDTPNNRQYVTFKATALTGTPGATTLGFTVAGTDFGIIAEAEILTAGTLTEDASAPPEVNTTSLNALTTASFTPPAGSLLVALVSSAGGSGVETMALTDTSGLGLTWTELVKRNGSGEDYAGVWAAQIPGGSGTPPPQPGPPSWRRRFRLPQAPFPPNPAAPVPPSFTAPASPLRGPAAARKGTLTGAAAPPPPAPQPPPLPQPGSRSWQRRFRPAQTPWQPPAPPGVPAPFFPPSAPLRGAPAGPKGTLASIQVTPPRAAPGPPAPFTAPRTLLRGLAAAVRGKLTAARGQPGVPSPFRLPGPLRGASATRKGTLTGGRGRPGVPAPFTPPARLAPPPAFARPGRLTGGRGRAGIPSPFTAPGSPLHGQPAARRGALAGIVAPPPVIHPNVPAPFFPPHSLLRGQAGVMAPTRTAYTAAPPPVTTPPIAPPAWQGATHIVAATASGNLIQGARHTGKGGPGPDLKGDYERSGD